MGNVAGGCCSSQDGTGGTRNLPRRSETIWKTGGWSWASRHASGEVDVSGASRDCSLERQSPDVPSSRSCQGDALVCLCDIFPEACLGGEADGGRRRLMGDYLVESTWDGEAP